GEPHAAYRRARTLCWCSSVVLHDVGDELFRFDAEGIRKLYEPAEAEAAALVEAVPQFRLWNTGRLTDQLHWPAVVAESLVEGVREGGACLLWRHCSVLPLRVLVDVGCEGVHPGRALSDAAEGCCPGG